MILKARESNEENGILFFKGPGDVLERLQRERKTNMGTHEHEEVAALKSDPPKSVSQSVEVDSATTRKHARENKRWADGLTGKEPVRWADCPDDDLE